MTPNEFLSLFAKHPGCYFLKVESTEGLRRGDNISILAVTGENDYYKVVDFGDTWMALYRIKELPKQIIP